MNTSAQTARRVYWINRWRIGAYNIGTTKVLMLGPVRVFLR